MVDVVRVAEIQHGNDLRAGNLRELHRPDVKAYQLALAVLELTILIGKTCECGRLVASVDDGGIQ